MKLRTRTLLIISPTLVVLIVLLYALTRSIVMGGFTKVEKELNTGFSSLELTYTKRNVARVVDALGFRVDGLATKLADWAMWDDTYKYIRDRNKEFIESNVNVDALTALKINHILFFDKSEQMVMGLAGDLDSGTEVSLQESLKKYLQPGSFLFKHESETSLVAGILLLPEGPLMIVSRPIVKSDGSGPIRGTMLFARFLDDVEFDNLASVTHLTLNRVRAGDAAMPADFKEAGLLLTDAEPVLVRTLSRDSIAGYTVIRDLEDRPALVIRVDILRDIFQQGNLTLGAMRSHARFTLISLVVCILITGLVLGAVIMVLLNRLVLSRVSTLSAKAVEIGGSGDFQGRVEVKGEDEITSLAASINKMLFALSATHLEIQARNAEMRLLMNTIPVGLMSIDENDKVNPEFSRMASRILEKENLAGMPLNEAFCLNGPREADGAKLTEYLDILRRELTSEETMATLNPFEELDHGCGGQKKWISIKYFLIRRAQGTAHHVLVVMEDITTRKKMAEEVVRSQRENMQLKAIAEDPDLFREFLMETGHILTRVELLSEGVHAGAAAPAVIQEISRGVHTIKGVSGSFGLGQVVEIAGQIEDSLTPFSTGTGVMAQDEVEELLSGLAGLKTAFREVVEGAKKILGDDMDRDTGIFLKVPLSELKRYQAEIASMEVESELKEKIIRRLKEEMLKRLTSLQNVPVKKGLARSLKIVAGLKKRLNKEGVLFTVEGEETPVNAEIAHELNTPLIHMIRNAFDHGIEDVEERMDKGKKGAGEIRLAVSREDESMVLTLSDDGRGMDPEKIRAKAVEKGFLDKDKAAGLTPDECFGLIFRSGFSTKETVTDVSGRGVGMDAVQDSIRHKLKGDVIVKSQIGKGSVFTIRVPCATVGEA